MAQAFNLQIQPTLKTKDMKIINGIAAFIENSDIVRYELEKRALRAAKEVAPERSGGLKKAIEVSNSTPTGFTLGVSNNITSGEDAVTRKDTTTYYVSYRRVYDITPQKYLPKELRRKSIERPTKYLIRNFNYSTYKTREQFKAELKAYYKAVREENERINALLNKVYKKTKTEEISFKQGVKYNEYRDGGSKVRANMQEFGYPYKTSRWGPYKPNPHPPKGPQGKGYLRLGQVLAAKSLTKDSISYSVNITDQEVIRYEKTVETELIKTYTKLLAKFLRKQKLPAYFKNIDTLKQKAPIPERALAYGNVTNINLDLPLQFPSNDYSFLEDNGKLAGIRYSLRDKRPFEPGFNFLIDE